MKRSLAAVVVLAACARSELPPRESPLTVAPRPTPDASAPATDASAAETAPARIDPDGNDETETAELAVPARGTWQKVGRHWAALERVCDLTVHGDALVMAHATEPLGLGGATLTRHRPGDAAPFALSFDWNRPGEPEQGGGAAGQGFLRVRSIEGRLWVPDADPPYLGFGITKSRAEGYVFVSDEQGRFDRAQKPGHRPPPSAAVLPGALHVFDVIQFRGRLYASASALVPPSGRNARSPGTLFVRGSDPRRWEVAFTNHGASASGARLGYMVRFRDRLFVALSPLDGSDPHDYIVFDLPKAASELAPEHARLVRVTPGAAHTLRWHAHREKLYWIAASSSGVELRVTSDGESWKTLGLPAELGHPADVLGAGDRVLVLTERALLEIANEKARIIARVETEKTPFAVDDAYCAPPLAAFRGKLYAGSQRKGALYELVPSD